MNSESPSIEKIALALRTVMQFGTPFALMILQSFFLAN